MPCRRLRISAVPTMAGSPACGLAFLTRGRLAWLSRVLPMRATLAWYSRKATDLKGTLDNIERF